MVASEEFSSCLIDELGPISVRRMFGKTRVFCDGVMFAMFNNELVGGADDPLNFTERAALAGFLAE
jgi:TfoX/Sxy family transcriptional regulator of competence genes